MREYYDKENNTIQKLHLYQVFQLEIKQKKLFTIESCKFSHNRP